MNAARPLLRCSTDDLPVRDRIPIWCEVFGRVLLKMEFRPVAERPFLQSAEMYAFDELGLLFGKTNGLLAQRTKAQLADSNDDFVFHANIAGFSLLSQMRRELKLEAGEGIMVTSGEACSQDFPEPAHGVSLRIPRRTLASIVAHPEDALMRRVPAGTPALRLLIDYVTLVIGNHDLESVPLQQAFATHVHDLVALTLGATRDATDLAQSRGLRAARLQAIKSDISLRFTEESLSVGDVARRHGVTPRYVHMLFEAEGRTFTEFVIERRLTQAHRMLTNPQFSDRNISAIAFEVGFANLSYFNRVFRRRYGASPSDIRAAAGQTRDGRAVNDEKVWP
jgi:AraC-like DNA-binding protein